MPGWTACVQTLKAEYPNKPPESFIISACTLAHATCPEPPKENGVRWNEDGPNGDVPTPLQYRISMVATILHPLDGAIRKYTMIQLPARPPPPPPTPPPPTILLGAKGDEEQSLLAAIPSLLSGGSVSHGHAEIRYYCHSRKIYGWQMVAPQSCLSSFAITGMGRTRFVQEHIQDAYAVAHAGRENSFDD